MKAVECSSQGIGLSYFFRFFGGEGEGEGEGEGGVNSCNIIVLESAADSVGEVRCFLQGSRNSLSLLMGNWEPKKKFFVSNQKQERKC